MLGIIGWAILLTEEAGTRDQTTLRVRYLGCILVVSPAYSTIPLQLSWVSANNPTQTQRAVALGMLNTIGQLGSVLGSFSFPSNEGPQYVRGVGVNMAFQGFGAAVALAMTTWLRLENRRRDKVEGGVPAERHNLNVQQDFDRAKGEYCYHSALACGPHGAGFRYVV